MEDRKEIASLSSCVRNDKVTSFIALTLDKLFGLGWGEVVLMYNTAGLNRVR